jgi:hypothetical protein
MRDRGAIAYLSLIRSLAIRLRLAMGQERDINNFTLNFS